MFNQYPYINLNDLNLDYILKAIKEMRYEVTNFVSINAIKYADPIQWNITSQYEKNTIVIDPLTGTAYISVAPVPAGVALTRPEYWTVVFDLGAFVTRAAKNFTLNYEEDTTTTATFSTTAGEWLIWGDTLYVAKVNITAGDAYVVDSNIERITIEEVKNNLITIIDGYYDTITGIIGELADLTTTDTDSIVDAINSIITERGALSDLTTTDKDSIVNAINSIITERGALSDLTTSDNTSIVNAINEINLYRHFVNVKELGAVGDGVTNDTQILQDAIDNYDCIYIPDGDYLIDTLSINKSVIIKGAGSFATHLIRNNITDNLINISGGAYNINIDGLRLLNGGISYNVYASDCAAISMSNATNGLYTIRNCWIDSGDIGIFIDNMSHVLLDNTYIIQEPSWASSYSSKYGIQLFGHNVDIKISHCFIAGIDIASANCLGIGLLIQGADGVNIDNSWIYGTRTAIYLTNQYYSVDDVYFSNCIIDNVADMYIDTNGVEDVTKAFINISFIECHFGMTPTYATTPVAISIKRYVKFFKMIGCMLNGFAYSGLALDGGNGWDGTEKHSHIISNNTFANGNLNNGAGASAIIFSAQEVICSGNVIQNSVNTTGHWKYGVNDSGSYNIVTDNIISDVETAPIYHTSTTSIIRDNIPDSTDIPKLYETRYDGSLSQYWDGTNWITYTP